MTRFYRKATPVVTAVARSLQSVALLLALVLSISSPAIAKGPRKPFLKITDVNALSLTVGVGSDGSSHLTYSINDSTKVTLNGAPANARDLRDGMVAQIEASSDGKIALTVTAKDPPSHPARHRAG
jgi:hypothetical protein